MNIRSITMDRALSTLTHQSRVVPTLLFRSPESINYETGEVIVHSFIEEGRETTPRRDDEDNDNLDELELDELYSTNTAQTSK